MHTTYSNKSNAARAARKALAATPDAVGYNVLGTPDTRFGFELVYPEAPTVDVEQAALDTYFEAAFVAAGGRLARGKCRALRTVAATWEAPRAAFIAAAKAAGVNANNASIEYHNGRK